MGCETSKFDSITCHQNKSVVLWDDHTISSKGVGSASMKLMVGKKKHLVTFIGVLYVPGLGTTLISGGDLL